MILSGAILTCRGKRATTSPTLMAENVVALGYARHTARHPHYQLPHVEIMLMRQVEAGMFDKTRAWLRSDPANRFFLIVDELHSYRGTPGTEVAYILRLLLDRLGLSTDSDQLALLATSASVDDTPKSRKFLREFFGRDNFQIVSEDQKQP